MKVRDHHLRLVLTAVLPVGILAAILAWFVVDNERRTLQGALADVAHAITQSVDSELRRSITALEVLALSDRLDGDRVDAFRAEAEAVMRKHGGWTDVLLFRADGARLMSLQVPPGQALPPARDVSIIERTFREGRSYISDVAVGSITRQPRVFISVPVFRDGRVAYALQASMEYPVWTEWLKRQLPDRWIAAIDDRSGTIFARSERPEAFVGKPGTAAIRELYRTQRSGFTSMRNIEGESIYAAFDTSDLAGWHVLVLTPASVIAKEANEFRWIVFASYILIVLLGLGAALGMSRSLTRGIARLRDGIGRLGSGESPDVRRTHIVEIDEAGDSILRADRLLTERAHRVAELQAELAQRAEAAERANRMKDQFLGMLGHEIRNPLSAIANATSVLLMRSQGQEREMHELIARQTRHLASLVDDLLDVSRLAQGKLRVDRQEIDLADVVGRVRDAFDAEGATLRHPITWSLQESPVRADPVRMTQVVRNLLDNALRYTPPGKRISVRLAREGSQVMLRVSDEGVGIDPELLTRIFEPFVQAPQDIDRRAGGLGLGLAIVRQVVQMHDGRILAASEGPGLGATFTVELPLSSRVEEAGSPGDVLPRCGRRLHLAIVEDHDDARRSLRLLLERLGCQVEEANDGREGFALLSRPGFDAAFVDLGLPGMDGFEIARRLRKAGRRIRLIAVTGYGQAGDRARALAEGFDDFIVKPVNEERLAAALAACEPAAAVGPPGAGR
jgi:signal transduction histidine kinase/ActR/RegA family two-component response regulator